MGKDLLGFIEFDNLPQIHKGGIIGDPGRLLHIVGDDDDGHILFELHDKFFNLRCRCRIERGGRFIKKEDFRIGSEGSCDT